MAYPHSYNRYFTLNGMSFRHHHAQDAHGTVTDTYSVNEKIVSQQVFFDYLQNAVGDAEFYIARACSLIKGV